MRAVVITEPGGPEVLRWLDVPDPVPGPAARRATLSGPGMRGPGPGRR